MQINNGGRNSTLLLEKWEFFFLKLSTSKEHISPHLFRSSKNTKFPMNSFNFLKEKKRRAFERHLPFFSLSNLHDLMKKEWSFSWIIPTNISAWRIKFWNWRTIWETKIWDSVPQDMVSFHQNPLISHANKLLPCCYKPTDCENISYQWKPCRRKSKLRKRKLSFTDFIYSFFTLYFIMLRDIVELNACDSPLPTTTDYKEVSKVI